MVDRVVDELTAEIFTSDASYYSLLVPSLFPVLLLFHFLIWLGFEFFVSN